MICDTSTKIELKIYFFIEKFAFRMEFFPEKLHVAC
jgi:hypothetical protein